MNCRALRRSFSGLRPMMPSWHVAAEPGPRRFLLSRRGSFDLEIAMINEPSKAQLESARMEMAESSRQSHEENALKPFLNQQQIKQLDQWIKKAERPETEPDRSCATHDRDRVA